MTQLKNDRKLGIDKSSADKWLEALLLILFVFGLIVAIKTTLVDPQPSWLRLTVSGTALSGAIAGLLLQRFAVELSEDIRARRDRGDPIDFEWVNDALGFLKYVPTFHFGGRGKKGLQNQDFGESNDK